MHRPEDKDEEITVVRIPAKARPFVEELTKRLLEFAETTVEEQRGRRYVLARGVEFATIFVDHGRAMADVRAPRPGSVSASSVSSLRHRMHEGAHREGWVMVPLETREDVAAAVELARMGYEEVLGLAPAPAVRKERPLESFAEPASAAAKGVRAKPKSPAKKKTK